MKKLFLLLFIVSFSSLFGQNWSIINSNERYHYQKSGSDFYTNTIQVDSVFFDGIDSIFYLNTIAKPCDTCSTLGTYVAYQPQCFNKIVRKRSNGIFDFYRPDTFVINTNAIWGDSWIYQIKGIDTVFASVVNIDSSNVLGMPDSVMTILLSTNDTLRLSKSDGMLYMQELIDSQQYNLIGLQTAHIGFTLPTWREFYNFNVGDSFFYYSSSMESGDPGSFQNEYLKVTILSKTITDTSFIYHIYFVNKFHLDYPFITSGSAGYDNLTYNPHYFEYNVGTRYTNAGANIFDTRASITSVTPISGRIKLGNLNSSPFSVLNVGDQTFLIPRAPCEEYYQDKITGLGNTYYKSYGCLSDFQQKVMICYNDTETYNLDFYRCGNFYGITNIGKSAVEQIDIKSNSDDISITNLSGFSVNYLLFDNMGRTIASGDSKETFIKIDIASLSSGLYFLKMNIGSNSMLTKVFK